MTGPRLAAAITVVLAAWLFSAVPAMAGPAQETASPPAEAEKKDWWAPKTPAAKANSARKPSAERPRPRKSKGIRTLDEITIEGEIAVPQVLFIMARERHRYLDRLHRRYLKSSVEIGRETRFPTQFATQLLP